MKHVFILFFSILSLWSFAQKQTPAKEKAYNVYFYKTDRTEVSVKDSADIIQVITEPPAGEKLFTVQEYYKAGALRFVGRSSQVHPVRLENESITYYSNGNKQLIATYSFGRKVGEAYYFYPNGKNYLVLNYGGTKDNAKNSTTSFPPQPLIKNAFDSTGNMLVNDGKGHFIAYDDNFKLIAEEGEVNNYVRTGNWKGYDASKKISFTESYDNGTLVSGLATDSAGIAYNYTQRIKNANYPGDSKAFYSFLANQLRYPALSRENNHTGIVIIRFRINPEGQADSFMILQGVDPYINAEALRVIKLAKAWLPAEYYGKKTAQYYEVPISFSIKNQ